MKRFLCCFATMLIIFLITDFYMEGSLLRLGEQVPDEISAGLSSMNNTEIQPQEQKGAEEFASRSCEFVQAAFDGDKAKVADMLCESTVYLVSEDKSSYIRYSAEDLLVEGYMATDRKLVLVRQNWCVIEDDGTITSGVEVEIEGEKAPQIWYIHYKRSFGQWKIFMLENGV